MKIATKKWEIARTKEAIPPIIKIAKKRLGNGSTKEAILVEMEKVSIRELKPEQEQDIHC